MARSLSVFGILKSNFQISFLRPKKIRQMVNRLQKLAKTGDFKVTPTNSQVMLTRGG